MEMRPRSQTARTVLHLVYAAMTMTQECVVKQVSGGRVLMEGGKREGGGEGTGGRSHRCQPSRHMQEGQSKNRGTRSKIAKIAGGKYRCLVGGTTRGTG